MCSVHAHCAEKKNLTTSIDFQTKIADQFISELFLQIKKKFKKFEKKHLYLERRAAEGSWLTQYLMTTWMGPSSATSFNSPLSELLETMLHTNDKEEPLFFTSRGQMVVIFLIFFLHLWGK